MATQDPISTEHPTVDVSGSKIKPTKKHAVPLDSSLLPFSFSHTLLHAHTHTHTHTRTHAHTHAHTHTRTHARTHAHARTHTRTHIHTPSPRHKCTHYFAPVLFCAGQTMQDLRRTKRLDEALKAEGIVESEQGFERRKRVLADLNSFVKKWLYDHSVQARTFLPFNHVSHFLLHACHPPPPSLLLSFCPHPCCLVCFVICLTQLGKDPEAAQLINAKIFTFGSFRLGVHSKSEPCRNSPTPFFVCCCFFALFSCLSCSTSETPF